MRTGLGMDGDDVGTRLGECFQIRIDRRDHEMDVERLCGAGTYRLDDIGTEADVRHKMPIHDVAMDPVGTRRVDGLDLLAEAREICRQDGGRNDCFATHGHGFAAGKVAADPREISPNTRLDSTSEASIDLTSSIVTGRPIDETSRLA